MHNQYPLDPKKLRKFNLAKYKGIPPSWDLIESVIEKSGLRMLARFEYVWVIPRSTLTWYKTGEKILAPKYWHIFYDFDNINKEYRRHTSNKKKRSNETSVSTSILIPNKHHIDEFKIRQSTG